MWIGRGWFGWLLWAFQCCHFWACVQARLVWMHIVLISVRAVQEAAFVWLQVGLVGLHCWLIFVFSWLSSGLRLVSWTCLRLVVWWLVCVVSLHPISSIFSWLPLLVKAGLAYMVVAAGVVWPYEFGRSGSLYIYVSCDFDSVSPALFTVSSHCILYHVFI